MDLKALLDEYEENHQPLACKASHAVGIPLIALALPIFPFNWRRGLQLFALGWLLQFAGHAAEGKRPKFFEGAEFLLAGMVWWLRLASMPIRAVRGAR